MKFHELPEYDELKSWINANGNIEVKLFSDREVCLHLIESEEDVTVIEDGHFYAENRYTEFTQLSEVTWVRERLGIDMGNGMIDADYVNLSEFGTYTERQHNHTHLDNDVRKGKKVKLVPVE